jgi:predicted nucleic acid-binding protein
LAGPDDHIRGAGHCARALPPVHLLIAALADRHGLGILRYDHDYDVIAEKTDLRFDSVWLAERGAL